MQERRVQDPVARGVASVESGVKVCLEHISPMTLAHLVFFDDGSDQSHPIVAEIGEAREANPLHLELPCSRFAIPGVCGIAYDALELGQVHRPVMVPRSFGRGYHAGMTGPLTITTWNVNSIRSRLDHVLTYLADHEPSVLCLQETKVEDALFPRVPFMELGYKVTIHGSKSLAGVATLTKSKPTEVHKGFRDGPADRHCRILNTVVNGVRIYNLYCPNGTEVGSDAYQYKLAWFKRLRTELDATVLPTDPLIICGDFNVALDERDLWDASQFEGRLLYTDEERQALANLIDFGLTDCFRQGQPEGGHFTWFDYRTNGLQLNEGMRIDHVYATASLAARCERVEHDLGPRRWESPSDHVPVTADFSAP